MEPINIGGDDAISTATSAAGTTSSKRKMNPPDSDGNQPPQKSRRVLACDTCRRIKSRCDLDVNAGCCNRCKNLRLECSLQSSKRSMPDIRPDIRQDDQTSSVIKELKERIEEQSIMLKELKEIISKSPTYSSSNAREEPSSTRTALHRVMASSNDLRIHEDQKSALPADQDTQSAPVSIIRSINSRMTAGMNRLFNGTLKDGVNQAMLSPAVAEDLLEAFFTRAGRWLQFETWEVMSVDGNPRRNAPLLYATACLHGGRLTDSFCNTVAHETLYEEVRSMLGQVLMVSPLPIESVYALALMAIWGIAPKGKSEYIDSWLFSGYCVQQAMLSINFTKIMANVAKGRSTVYERTALRLWNIVCLCHLHFAVGTGRPSVIAPAYLDQCPSILNIYESSTQDRMIVAEILLYSTLQKLLTRSFPVGTDGSCLELEAWNKKWGHLFEVKDDRARAFHISYHFAHLVLAQRSLKQLPTTPPNPQTPSHPSPSEQSPNVSQRLQYIHLSCTYASNLLKIIRTLANTTLKELPENLHLSVAYSMIVLSEHLEECLDVKETTKLLQDVLVYYSQAIPKTVAIVEFAVAKLGHGKGGEQHQPLVSEVGEGSGVGGIEGVGVGPGFEGGWPGTFEGDVDWGFPTLEDLFSGSFANNIPWDVQNFEI